MMYIFSLDPLHFLKKNLNAAEEVPAMGIWGENGALFHNLFSH